MIRLRSLHRVPQNCFSPRVKFWFDREIPVIPSSSSLMEKLQYPSQTAQDAKLIWQIFKGEITSEK